VTGYVLTPRAQADLDEIWDYTAEHWGDDQAAAYARQIQAAIEAVAADPSRGGPCDDIRPGYRKLSVGSHVLFYRCIENGVDIVRILHQRMDFNRHL
jgi:toxin ParE1/3/4